MARSRSSFDFDLSNAIASATNLSGDDRAKKASGADAMPEGLVSFDAPEVPQLPPPAARPSSPPASADGSASSDASRALPKLPDLTSVKKTLERCERIVQWIEEATGATNVFLADAAGLPLAGSVNENEARLAGSGLVASSIATLASAVPGNPSPQFELHIGEGPFYQIIGFKAGNTLFIVGLNRNTPLSPRQAHAIRLACRYALGDLTG
ncbi:MAG: hypothetical protein IPM54_23810 [Polyangiaceae bacterium]|nr:hypothetical protein [Polyangiaceae bacterium]